MIHKITIIFFFSYFHVFSQKEKHKNTYANYSCEYETTEMRLDGLYKSYYKNGKPKARGKFDNNCRIGKWTIWDSLGRVRLQRIYKTPYDFKRVIPKIPNDASVKLMMSQPAFTPTYSTQGYLNYPYIHEAAVYWQKRKYIYLYQKNNPVLFENNKLYNVVTSHILDTTLKCYKDEEFYEENYKETIDTTHCILLGYKLKSDEFFNGDLLIMETRLIGICPVMYNSLTKDTIDLCWIYEPALRPFMAQISLNNSIVPQKIKTLDDVFFYKYYYGKIYREENVYDKKTEKWRNQFVVTDSIAELIRIEYIEKEHDILIGFTE